MIKSFLILVLFMASFKAQAESIDKIRFLATVQSYDQNWIEIVTAGKNFRVPRASVKGDLVPEKQYEVAVTSSQYSDMKLHHYIKASTQTK